MGEKHTITCLVENQFGVLARIAGLISARGFNIDSLTVSATEDPTTSRMTIVVDADALKLEQVKRQLGRLIDVIEVKELTDERFIGRDLLLVRVEAAEKSRPELEEFTRCAGAKLAHVTDKAVVIELVGKTAEIDGFVEKLRSFGIVDLVRTGRVALEKE